MLKRASSYYYSAADTYTLLGGGGSDVQDPQRLDIHKWKGCPTEAMHYLHVL